MQSMNLQQQKPVNLVQSTTASTRAKTLSKEIFIFILNSSIIVKSLCISLILGYLLTFLNKLDTYLCVIPGKLMPPSFFLWTLVTHSFIETEFLQMLIDMFVILLYCKMLEPLWGSRECLKFYFLITCIVSIETTLIYFFLYSITFKEVFIFTTLIHGLSGFIGGFSVAIKQIMPDTILISFGILRLKQDDLPLLFLIASALFYLIGLIDLTFLIMLFFGIITSWIYLRFFQIHKNGIKGDSSNTFSFASFFPSIIQPFVAIISNTIFDILVRIRICNKPPKRYNINTTQSSLTLNLANQQTLDATDAERRRQKALKALKERLNKTDTNDTGSQWNSGNDNANSDLTAKLLNEEHVIDEKVLYTLKTNSSTTIATSVSSTLDSTTGALNDNKNISSNSTVIDLNNK